MLLAKYGDWNWNVGKELGKVYGSKMPVRGVKPLITNLLAFRPLDIVAMDFTLLEKSSDGRENVLVITDVLT